ncbi:hypothetical protein SAMN05892883_0634 [Jatrophihabitans sp. GAS493]|uniref:hypothetical protein n=1 Tax=Jatrophihabitans sp. GAS493 TaxID=1907575 RepID=UPI000BB88FD3|nr:hypothetical protein [Jatrophihabitans sp. GAS493]SOD71032.1 hypothetical protein SAMN05892883_0634 [Jatrophihabitans sp. GAS493]
MIVLIAVETALLLVLCVLVAGLLSGYAGVLRRLHELDGGDEPPPFKTAPGVQHPETPRSATTHQVQRRDEWSPGHDIDGSTLDGEVVHLRTVEVEHDTVIAFLSSGCAGCAGFWEELGRPGSWALPAGSRLVIVAKDGVDESPASLRELAPAGVDLLLSTAAWQDYDVPGSPYVVVVDGPTGRTKGAGSGTSFSQVTALIAQSEGDRRELQPPLDGIRKPRRDTEREGDVDRVLLEAGIAPGHPSLYPPV